MTVAANVVASARKYADWDVLFFGYCLEHCDKVRAGLAREMLTAVRPLW